jgi:excisionase family DNA binding protein
MSSLRHRRVLYTVTETARLLSVSNSTIWRQLAAGSLPSVRVGGRRLIAADTIDAIAAGRVSA